MLRIFTSIFIRNIGLWFSFLVVFLSGSVIWPHRMSVEVLPPPWYFGKVWGVLVLIILKYLVGFSKEVMWSLSFLLQLSWLLIQSLYALFLCSDFLFLPDSVFVNCVFLKMYPFLLGYVICWQLTVHSSPMILCLPLVSDMLFPVLFYSLSLFSWSS